MLKKQQGACWLSEYLVVQANIFIFQVGHIAYGWAIGGVPNINVDKHTKAAHWIVNANILGYLNINGC